MNDDYDGNFNDEIATTSKTYNIETVEEADVCLTQVD